MPEVVIGSSKRRELYYVLLGALIALLGALRLATGSPLSLSLSGLLPLLMIVAGCLLTTVFLVRYRGASDALVINNEGLVILRPPIGGVPWSRIVSIRSDRVRGRQFLHIRLDNVQLQVANNAAARRWITGDELWFDASGIDMDVEDIVRAITPHVRTVG